MKTVRTMASALLINGNDMLMMKRSLTRELAPGLWALVGGHLEPGEHPTPSEGCLREVFEETGIDKSQITDFHLRYIMLRLKDDEIRHNYIYVGKTSGRQLSQTDEGELHWIDRSLVLGLDMTPTTRFFLEHYLTAGHLDTELRVGTVAYHRDGVDINWAVLR